MSETLLLVETDKWRIEVEQKNDVVLVRPIGKIDEDSEFEPFFQHLQELKGMSAEIKIIAFDLGQITSINSCGVREWIIFIERIQAMKVKYGFARLNELAVEQANMMANFLGRSGVPVLTVDIPYFCAKCDTRIVKTAKITEITKKTDGTFAAPPAQCGTCKETMQFDALEEEYFLFLGRPVGK